MADMAKIARPLKGTAATDAERMELKRSVISVIRKVAGNYGYDEMETPLIYGMDLLTYKFDPSSELLDEIYTATDRGDRELGLRYDLTVPLAGYVAERAKGLKLPFRRFEVGEVFRDGPVKAGRCRQFTQCDMDIVGDDDPVMTAYEQMSMMVSALDGLGLDDATIRYSSRKIAEGLALYFRVSKADVGQVMRAMDKRDKVSADEFRREIAQAGLPADAIDGFEDMLRLDKEGLVALRAEVEEKRDERYAVLDGLGFNDAFYDWRGGLDLLASGIDEVLALAELMAGDERMRDRCVLDLSLVRGQDYYTGIMFEAYVPDLASSIAAGGRYGSIIGDLAGASDTDAYSASGVSFGIEPIMRVLEGRSAKTDWERARRGLRIIVCDGDDGSVRCSAMRFASELRRRVRVEVDMSDRSVSKRMRAADRDGCAFVIVYGPDEVERSAVCIKSLESGEEISVSLADPSPIFEMTEDDLEAMLS